MIKATFRTKLKENDKVFSTSNVNMIRLKHWRIDPKLNKPPDFVGAIAAQKARDRESIKKEAKALGGAHAASGRMRP